MKKDESFIREQMNKHQVHTLLKTESLPILRPCGAPKVRWDGVPKMGQKDLESTSSQGRTKITTLSTKHYCWKDRNPPEKILYNWRNKEGTKGTVRQAGGAELQYSRDSYPWLGDLHTRELWLQSFSQRRELLSKVQALAWVSQPRGTALGRQPLSIWP